MEIGLPANGRTINAGELIKILFEYIPEAVHRSLRYQSLDQDKIEKAVGLAMNQDFIRKELKRRSLVAFIANGSILPRESGVSGKPMKNAIAWVSPKSLEVTMELPFGRAVTGTGIPEGVTLIVGGGYHGKSTLLEALELGVYNHIAGDGREYVITDDKAMKIRAEDGRSIQHIDISMFIRNLPNGKNTKVFCTEDASGSTSQAANEAPPAIISVFLGEQLEDVVKQLIETGDAAKVKEGGKLLTGVSTLPDLQKDATDRNRTSPFAFTGNKFEFRMVGSADSIASPNTTLNAIVAEAFCEAADILEKADDFDMAVHDLIKEYLTKHQRIIFNGNGYSDEWVAEAERRGLPNIKSMIEAAPTLTTDKAVKLFEKFHIFTKVELESREEIIYETYAKTINIEALTMIDMAGKDIIPAVSAYTGDLANTVLAVKEAGATASTQVELLKKVDGLLTEAQAALETLQAETAKASAIEDVKAQAFYYKDTVKAAMDALRAPVDKLEMVVDSDIWPMPTYGELMFEV